MCAIVGALIWNHARGDDFLNAIYRASHARGRDGRGVVRKHWKSGSVFEARNVERVEPWAADYIDFPKPRFDDVTNTLINLRAEPTTEYVKTKERSDQQPYCLDNWTIVHNGTIANDKNLRSRGKVLTTAIDSAAIVEQLVFNDIMQFDPFYVFTKTIRRLKGSFAILATNSTDSRRIYFAANYRPIWYVLNEWGLFFASSRDYFPSGNAQMIKPYSIGFFEYEGGELKMEQVPLIERNTGQGPRRALVVCSGGLDSVVAATVAQRSLGYEITLLHFLYGARVEGHEADTVEMVAKHLKCDAKFIPLRGIYNKEDSPLLDLHSKLAGGEPGAEFAHEWVPARNLVMLAVATAFAEAHGFDTVILGNNLEEAGAYPDNEPEFINRFNDMLPFAVADGKEVRVEMPVGNLMKHEIVALGHSVGAPLHLTWSCYRAGEKHCGQCGPCFMRRTAFQINNLPEVIEYVSSDEDLRA